MVALRGIVTLFLHVIRFEQNLRIKLIDLKKPNCQLLRIWTNEKYVGLDDILILC